MLPAMRFMHEVCPSGPALGNIAARAHLSPFHFHRRFTDLVGQTPKHFLVDCQMRQAKRLLVSRRHSLPEIAEICGFSHQSHFTSRFRQTTGLTPTRWRRLAAHIVMSRGFSPGQSGRP
jgi:AraC family transcriptional regulator